MIDPFFTYLSIIALIAIFSGKVINVIKNTQGSEIYPKEIIFVLFAIGAIMWFFLFVSFSNNLAYEATYQVQDPAGEYHIVAQDNYGALSAVTYFQMGTGLFIIVAFLTFMEMVMLIPKTIGMRGRKETERQRAT